MWFKFDPTAARHFKMKRLAKINQLSHNEAIGAVVKIWCLAVDNEIIDGDVSKWTDEELTEEAGLDPDRCNFAQMMVDCGLLERRDGGLFIHDWCEYGGDSLRILKQKREGGRKGGRISSRASKDNKQSSKESLKDSPKDTLEQDKKREEEKIRKEIDNTTMWNIFWKIYPKKEAKADSFKAWQQTDGVRPPTAELTDILKRHIKQWTDKKFIPLASSWLRGHRWEDEVTESREVADPKEGMIVKDTCSFNITCTECKADIPTGDEYMHKLSRFVQKRKMMCMVCYRKQDAVAS